MEVSHTGLFVPVDKTTLLLGTASPSLQRLCNMRAVIGPTQQRDKCCEILLLPIASSDNSCRKNYEQAKTILKNYLSLLVKESVMCKDKMLGAPVDSCKNDSNKATNVNNNKRSTSDIAKGKLQHGVINVNKYKDNHCDKSVHGVDVSGDRSIEILPSTTRITVKNKGRVSPVRFPAIQSPTISNSGDIEIVDLVADSPISSQSDRKVTDSLQVIFENKQKAGNKDGVVNITDYREPAKECDEENEVLCNRNSWRDLLKMNGNVKDCVSEACDSRPRDIVPEREDIVVLSEDDGCQKSGSNSQKSLTRKQKRNRRKKKKMFRKKVNSGYFNLFAKGNCCVGENKRHGNCDDKSTGSVLVGNSDNVDKEITNEENSLKTSTGLGNVNIIKDVTTEDDDLSVIEDKVITNVQNSLKISSSIDKEGAAEKEVTIEDDDLSVIEVDFRGRDEIILISENEDDEDGQNDVENNKNDNNSKTIKPNTDGDKKNDSGNKKKRKKRGVSKAELLNMSKDELIQRGFVIDPAVDIVKYQLIRSLRKRKRENQLRDFEASLVKPSSSAAASSDALSNARINSVPSTASVLPSNLLWSRPAHLSCLPIVNKSSHASTAALAGPPLIVKNLSTDATLNRKRKAPSPVPQSSDCSPSKKPVNLDKIGSNVCVPDDGVGIDSTKKTGLRPVIIDASNVAFSHGRNEDFSPKGIEICIRYFKSRGHQVIAILPNYRKAFLDDKLLHMWEKDGTLAFTPSRKVNGQMVVSHDDRYIIQVAAALEGVIVSQDHYRDFIGKNTLWDEAIKKRLLMFMWVGDLLMFPEDPLGRNGPTLNDFLRFPPSSTTTSSTTQKSSKS